MRFLAIVSVFFAVTHVAFAAPAGSIGPRYKPPAPPAHVFETSLVLAHHHLNDQDMAGVPGALSRPPREAPSAVDASTVRPGDRATRTSGSFSTLNGDHHDYEFEGDHILHTVTTSGGEQQVITHQDDPPDERGGFTRSSSHLTTLRGQKAIASNDGLVSFYNPPPPPSSP
ncbi:hypothetical protein K439DRAFT_1621214 [Ramaria rubella]|nr:hypothetical protein K439DRAFT_1621214 [Ramaria rubella]